jgi:hypothetical protein
MKGNHYRPWNWSRPNLIMFVLALCVSVIGLVLGVEALHDKRAESITPATSTTIPMILGDPVVATTMVTTVARATTSTTAVRKAEVQIGTALFIVREVSTTTTTTTEAPKTPLEVALKYLAQTGPWAEGGFYCAKAVSYFAEEAHVEGFVSRDGPSALYADALADGRFTQTPTAGNMIFIDLFGPDGIGHGQVTHVGIVETVEGLAEGSVIGIVQGNGEPDPSVITRTTYHLGDGFIVGFAPFTA